MNLKQLASSLKLSSTTVSRALNGYPEVSEATRRRVIAAAAKHQYQPCRQARQLATGRTNMIAHVIPRSRKTVLGPIFSDFVAGASDASSRLGFDTQLSIVDDDHEEAFYRQLAARRSVDGIVVHAPTIHDSRIELLNELCLPYVVHGRSGVAADYCWLDVDNAQAIERSTQFLFDLGHRRIALVNGPEPLYFATRRRLGYIRAHERQGLAIDERLMFNGPLTENHGFQATESLLAMKATDERKSDQASGRVTALVVCGIVPAYGALRSVLGRGLTIGKDISIVAFDDQLSHMSNEGAAPLFTSVRSSIHEAGTRVIELLQARILNPDAPCVGERWQAELVVGQSTGCAR